MPFAAAEQVHARMHEGARIRPATLNALLDGLIAAKAGPSNGELSVMGTSQIFARSTARIEAEFPNLADGTRTAIEIMRSARRTRNNRDGKMYDKIIEACLLQGEIVVGCMLFALIVRDWQVRRAIKPKMGSANTQPHGDPAIDGMPLQEAHINAARAIGLDNWYYHIPRPNQNTLQKLLSYMIFPGATKSASFSPRPGWKPPDVRQVVEMKRGIFILAQLLDDRQLDMNSLVPLIKVMSNVPRTPTVRISTLVGGLPAQYEVSDYCHETLWKFSQTLPDHQVTPSPRAPSMIAPVGVRVYNCLINYVLLHRMDVDAAHRLLEHMCVQRKPQLQPDIVTFNTLLRRGSLLRRNDIVEKAMALLKTIQVKDPELRAIVESWSSSSASHPPKNPWRVTRYHGADEENHRRENARSSRSTSRSGRAPSPAAAPAASVSTLDIAVYNASSTSVTAPAPPATLTSRPATDSEQISAPPHAFAHALEKLAIDKFEFPQSMDLSTLQPPDAFTLSSYITYWVSTNQIDRAIDFICMLLPQLTSVAQEGDVRTSIRARLGSARTQGAKLGSYFFSAAINALRKSGRIGLAERVWYLARLSEEASWNRDPAVSGGVKPWCLDITAYTAMLQCYAVESKKGVTLSFQSGKVFVAGWAFFNWNSETTVSWQQYTADAGAEEAQGSSRWTPTSRKRLVAAREMGQLLVQSMRTRAARIWRLFQGTREKIRPDLPVPDARFFNAMLDIYGRTPHMPPRKQRSSRGRVQNNYRRLTRLHAMNCPLARSHDPTLVEIAEEMAKYGYELPLGLRHSVIGRRISFGRPQPKPVRPRRFPIHRHRGFRAFALDVSKDRGLPIAREPKRWRGVIGDDWSLRFDRQRTATL
ncbi:hypothetical protein EXIGLDRAFT_720312 [Exidia glandulosa HHB12029]|uniref:Pentatricopeptide repeat-containing protein n=1 Tax=Exidia glandulosa HHB12029 TaxID=1314781 RepID=A0A165GHR2_EXIGL|nr:hypothetical protein EXIGLDRAFT_720312 [Exidia glandulosa HHB12029]